MLEVNLREIGNQVIFLFYYQINRFLGGIGKNSAWLMCYEIPSSQPTQSARPKVLEFMFILVLGDQKDDFHNYSTLLANKSGKSVILTEVNMD